MRRTQLSPTLVASIVVLVLTVLLLIPPDPATTGAQGTVRWATPTTGACVAPPVPPGTPTPREASPAAVAGEAVATPAPTPPPVGTPADQATVDRVVAAEFNLTHCFNAHNWLAAAALFTPEYWASPRGIGTTNLYDFARHLEEDVSAPQEMVAVENVEILADGRFRDEATFYFGDVLLRERDYWVERDGYLLYDWAETLSVDGTPVP
jgi:hypothetical protein